MLAFPLAQALAYLENHPTMRVSQCMLVFTLTQAQAHLKQHHSIWGKYSMCQVSPEHNHISNNIIPTWGKASMCQLSILQKHKCISKMLAFPHAQALAHLENHPTMRVSQCMLVFTLTQAQAHLKQHHSIWGKSSMCQVSPQHNHILNNIIPTWGKASVWQHSRIQKHKCISNNIIPPWGKASACQLSLLHKHKRMSNNSFSMQESLNILVFPLAQA